MLITISTEIKPLNIKYLILFNFNINLLVQQKPATTYVNDKDKFTKYNHQWINLTINKTVFHNWNKTLTSVKLNKNLI